MTTDASALTTSVPHIDWQTQLFALLEALHDGHDIQGALSRALSQVCELLGLETGWVYLLDPSSGEPSLAAQRRLPPAFATQPERWEGLCGCIHGLIDDTRPPIERPAMYRCSRLWHLDVENPQVLKYHVCVPLLVDGRTIGIMNVASATPQAVEADSVALLDVFGRVMGLAVERARLLRLKHEDVIRDERERIARELHDTLMQGLTGITLQLETANALINVDAEAARGSIGKALQTAQSTIAETRSAIDDLGSVRLVNETLAEAIGRSASDFSNETGVRVELEVKLPSERLESRLETALLRIVRECLHNVVRHAGAKSVRIVARRSPERLTLIIADDGRGFDPHIIEANVHGYGLASMRRRVQLLNGRFRLITAPSKGTRVEISVPVYRIER